MLPVSSRDAYRGTRMFDIVLLSSLEHDLDSRLWCPSIYLSAYLGV